MITEYSSLLLILFCAYFVRGATGFGSGLIAVPFLAASHPFTFTVPVVLALDFIASFALTRLKKEGVAWTEVRALLPYAMLGAVAGTFFLLHLASSFLLHLLGALLLLMGICDVFGLRPSKAISSIWSAPFGLLSGCFGALFGISAPPYMIYLTRRLPDKTMVRTTFSWIFLIDGGTRLMLFLVVGLLLNRDTLYAIGLGILPMLAGIFAGNRIHLKMSNQNMRKVIGAVLIASGVSLLIRTRVCPTLRRNLQFTRYLFCISS